MSRRVRTELAGWREALTAPGVLAGIAVRLLTLVLLVAVVAWNADKPVVLFVVVPAAYLVGLLGRLRIFGRL